MNNAVVIGYGMVGKSTAHAFGIEKYYSRSKSNITLEEASKNRYIFICLPTPTIDGKCFTDDIRKIVGEIHSYDKTNQCIFIIRSTVEPGFCQNISCQFNINVVSNPEFLSEDTWKKDAEEPVIIVIGSNIPQLRSEIEGLYKSRYKYIEPIVTDLITSELIKYTMNCFFSTKVIFANEIYDYAQKVGANYETIKKAIENHPWGSKNHFVVWYKDKRGVHGHCLPKDLKALQGLTESPLFQILLDINDRYK